MFSPERFVPAKSVFRRRCWYLPVWGFARRGGAPLQILALDFPSAKNGGLRINADGDVVGTYVDSERRKSRLPAHGRAIHVQSSSGIAIHGGPGYNAKGDIVDMSPATEAGTDSFWGDGFKTYPCPGTQHIP